jgi:4-diphosphocytidyl-2-C-methyl-D-erythritol kinase
MEIMAPAKLNLYLKVFRKRQDGYHELGTLFERVSVFDRISLEISASATKIEAKGEDIPTDENSLLYKTVTAFKLASGKSFDYKVDVEKNIPVAAGMGGGSSDAAALLSGMNVLAGTPMDDRMLEEVGSKLGADVPFFLKNTSFALGSGRGDVIKKINTSLKLGHIIVNPPVRSETKDVYRKLSGFNLTKDNAWATMLTLFLEKNDYNGLSEYLHNDLQQIVLRDFPELRDVIFFLRGSGARSAMMTGSGPTVFGVFDMDYLPEAAEKARARFSREEGWRVYEALTV